MSAYKSVDPEYERKIEEIKKRRRNEEEIYYVDTGNGLIEVGADEEARKFGIPKSEWEALQKYDLDRDPQFIEKLNRDSEEFYATVLGETPEEKEERKKREKTDEFWRQKHIQKPNIIENKKIDDEYFSILRKEYSDITVWLIEVYSPTCGKTFGIYHKDYLKNKQIGIGSYINDCRITGMSLQKIKQLIQNLSQLKVNNDIKYKHLDIAVSFLEIQAAEVEWMLDIDFEDNLLKNPIEPIEPFEQKPKKIQKFLTKQAKHDLDRIMML